MPIPGLKVLDEILAGLPTNSAQRLEIARLKEQIAALQNENEKLRRQNKAPENETSAFSFRRVGEAYFEVDESGYPKGYPYCPLCWENEHKRYSLTLLEGNRVQCRKCGGQYWLGSDWPADVFK